MIFIFAIIIFVVLILIVISISKDDKSDSRPQTDDRPFYRPGSFRGALGSPGTSPKRVGKHSINCECNICLYNHDPDDYACKCRPCRGLVEY